MAKRLHRYDPVRAAAMTLIGKIADRAVYVYANNDVRVEREGVFMDITLCHFHPGQRLRLDDLLAADDMNFIHDVAGINKHLDHETGELMDCFSPRFSA